MRTLPATAALLSLLLAACASAPNPPSKAVDQSGTLKIHPGLLGQPVPPELQPQEAPARPVPAPQESKAENADALKVDASGQWTQRSVYFDHNRADLKTEFAPVLKTHAAYLADHPKARVRIEGNADERGADGHNRRLALRRADKVKESLVAQGASARQIRTVSLGASNPKKKGHDEESWAENRRADIVYEKD